jgi:diaminohydroxyphosphoribosylaminopyrimidine deaminase / 5-amino-6-(5-phosphoribosylamino)uracil reductase
MAALDTDRIQEALCLAEQAIGVTEPNPRVGCVIGTETGLVLGRGATQQAGGPHAEVMALRDAAAKGNSVEGATAWVTLEPCAHHGRTPPCCEALVGAGVARVVVCLRDPFPAVAGAGLAHLRAAGIRVDWADAALAQAALDLNIGFFSRVLRARPWVRVKVATSLDGRTALQNGVSQWITGAEARADGHAWRKRASAILTGVGTVLADDPELTVRLVPSAWQPRRVVVDSHGRSPPNAKLFQGPGTALIATATQSDSPALTQLRLHTGCTTITLPDAQKRQVDLPGLLKHLADQGVNELHVEGGATLNGALAQAGLVDEWLVYLAPKLLGQGPGAVLIKELTRIDQAPQLQITDTQLLGPDLRIRLRAQGQGWADAASHRPDQPLV